MTIDSDVENSDAGNSDVDRRCVERVVVVTGGSQGIGRGIAECFLSCGTSVIVADLKPPANLKQWQADNPVVSKSEISGQTLSRLHWVETNVCSSESIADLRSYLLDAFGGLDVVVNNAGIMFEKSIMDQTEEDWDKMMAVNLKAPFLVTKGLLDLLQASERQPAIVNIGSIEGFAANPLHTAYSASKGGVHGLTVAMAVELGPLGIRVNAIAPGWINTELNREYLDSVGDVELANRELAKLHPVGYIGAVHDIGDVAVWLAGRESRFVAGELIRVDGGRMSKPSLPAMFNR